VLWEGGGGEGCVPTNNSIPGQPTNYCQLLLLFVEYNASVGKLVSCILFFVGTSYYDIAQLYHLQDIYSVQFLSFHLLYGLVLYSHWFSVGHSFQYFVSWSGLS
jgi:hypothetical protein